MARFEIVVWLARVISEKLRLISAVPSTQTQDAIFIDALECSADKTCEP